jgi:hypothetical protein
VSEVSGIDFFRDETGVGKGYLSIDYDGCKIGKRLCYRWSKTEEKATLEEAIALVDEYKNLLPDNEESFNEYYSQYTEWKGDKENLIDTEFSYPWHRLDIETKFCCMDGIMPTRVFANLDAFGKLLLKSTDYCFVDFMYDYVWSLGFGIFNIRKNIREKTICHCGVCPEEALEHYSLVFALLEEYRN